LKTLKDHSFIPKTLQYRYDIEASSNDNKLISIRKLPLNTSQPAMTSHIFPAPKVGKRTFIKDLAPGTKTAARHTPLKEYL